MMRNGWLIVVLAHGLYVYTLKDLVPVEYYETYHNPLGLCDASTEAGMVVVGLPSKNKGSLTIRNLTEDVVGDIKLHDSEITLIKINASGILGATAN
jgi:hypothetical protein